MNPNLHLKQAVLLWWRYGKEHFREEQRSILQVNNAETVHSHLQARIERHQQSPPDP